MVVLLVRTVSLKKYPKIALVGNPNSGKSSLFNWLTGLNQKIGNFPGVTVDKRSGFCKINPHTLVEIVDLPGTYSLYPKSSDERVVLDILANPGDATYPDALLVVADASSIQRNLLLFTEVRDLGVPTLLVLTMMDIVQQSGQTVDAQRLSEELHAPVVVVNARTGEGVAELKRALSAHLETQPVTATNGNGRFVNVAAYAPDVVTDVKEKFHLANDYLAIQYAHQGDHFPFLTPDDKQFIQDVRERHGFNAHSLQAQETLARYDRIHDIVHQAITQNDNGNAETFSTRIDKILLHPAWGYLIFFLVLFVIFQAIFAWATYPMDLIDAGIAAVNTYLQETLPESQLVNLLTDGLIAGLGGVLIFIPQIAILFAFIAILEESGYMARVVLIMDRFMRKFGLNGRSVVPLISGVACAVPAIMATRGIDNWRERLITILVTPLMSCSARIPVYTILIGLVVPDEQVAGFLNLQGLTLMGMYLLGFVAAIASALLMKMLLRTSGRSYLVMELPAYRMPRWKNIAYTIIEKVKIFVLEAGRVIVAISIVLWVLASYGPGNEMERAETNAMRENPTLSESVLANKVAAARLEASYAGHFGKFIEPVIAPLGYDWKIGIALITSFAAREVFVGTLSTIYSVGSDPEEDMTTIRERMRRETSARTGLPLYTPALAFSLLVFYAFAMQCMSTLAVVYRETKSWKWPVAQLLYMTGLAYVSAWGVYQWLS